MSRFMVAFEICWHSETAIFDKTMLAVYWYKLEISLAKYSTASTM